MAGKVIAVVGIDTDIGKTVATGLLAKSALSRPVSVITQKITQTGCQKFSEDIETHRKIMGIDVLDEDRAGLTCPYLFKEPCSPHLAARMENITIDLDKITEATRKLQEKYDLLFLEGAGGLQVPLDDQTMLLDYLQNQDLPVILVTGNKVGSINHTLLALEALAARKIRVLGMVYNRYASVSEKVTLDSKEIFLTRLPAFGYEPEIVDMYPVADHLSGEYPFDCKALIDQGLAI